MKQLPLVILLSCTSMFAAEPTTTATSAINALGLDLLPQVGSAKANALLSPYSIQTALAMTYAGSEGQTRSEMAEVLHYPADDAEVHHSFAALRNALNDVARRSARQAERARERGVTNDPITLVEANRLFGQTGYAFRESFLKLVKDDYQAPLEMLNFAQEPASATKHINQWVEDQTRQRISHLIPDGALNALTRLVLVNAIYLKAPWAEPFRESATHPEPFHLNEDDQANVPMMMQRHRLGYLHHDGYTALTIPYRGGDLQFLIFLPDKVDGLPALEEKLTAEQLAGGARLDYQEVILHLPKFKLEPPTLDLGHALQDLGMKTAFDIPHGSAKFDRMAPRRADDYLFISAVFHKTFLSLDEQGTEAAAATAVAMAVMGMAPDTSKPVEVRVDHPFLFAIQHRPSGTCLFLGHVTDPR